MLCACGSLAFSEHTNKIYTNFEPNQTQSHTRTYTQGEREARESELARAATQLECARQEGEEALERAKEEAARELAAKDDAFARSAAAMEKLQKQV